MADFKKLLDSEEYDFRFSCGVTKSTARMEQSDKKKVVDALCLHYTVLVSLAELEQLKRGLAMQKFDSLLESAPKALRKAFEPPEQNVHSEFIQDMFPAIFSTTGSNRRVVEENIMMTWVQYLQHIDGKLQLNILVQKVASPTGESGQSCPTMKDIMVFLTGCDTIPPLGFSDAAPAILFSDVGVLPTVSTCCLTLTFPRSFPTEFHVFKEKMNLAILGSQGFFGTV